MRHQNPEEINPQSASHSGRLKTNLLWPIIHPIEYLTTTKLHWNSVLSIPDEKYLVVYIKNFYINSTTKKNEYYNISIKIISQEIIYKYDLNNKQNDGYIYVRF